MQLLSLEVLYAKKWNDSHKPQWEEELCAHGDPEHTGLSNPREGTVYTTARDIQLLDQKAEDQSSPNPMHLSVPTMPSLLGFAFPPSALSPSVLQKLNISSMRKIHCWVETRRAAQLSDKIKTKQTKVSHFLLMWIKYTSLITTFCSFNGAE